MIDPARVKIPMESLVIRCPLCKRDVARHDGRLYGWSTKQERGRQMFMLEHRCEKVKQ